ncbi:hypothetical protein TURU_061542 [Turdus rufiventris]|nr:hypothetical protein TURU_061542 [Turdus rufiventris]
MPSTDRWSVTFLVLLDHTIADPSQDAAVLLGHPDTLACVQLAVDKHSQGLLNFSFEIWRMKQLGEEHDRGFKIPVQRLLSCTLTSQRFLVRNCGKETKAGKRLGDARTSGCDPEAKCAI